MSESDFRLLIKATFGLFVLAVLATVFSFQVGMEKEHFLNIIKASVSLAVFTSIPILFAFWLFKPEDKNDDAETETL